MCCTKEKGAWFVAPKKSGDVQKPFSLVQQTKRPFLQISPLPHSLPCDCASKEPSPLHNACASQGLKASCTLADASISGGRELVAAYLVAGNWWQNWWQHIWWQGIRGFVAVLTYAECYSPPSDHHIRLGLRIHPERQ